MVELELAALAWPLEEEEEPDAPATKEPAPHLRAGTDAVDTHEIEVESTVADSRSEEVE